MPRDRRRGSDPSTSQRPPSVNSSANRAVYASPSTSPSSGICRERVPSVSSVGSSSQRATGVGSFAPSVRIDTSTARTQPLRSPGSRATGTGASLTTAPPDVSATIRGAASGVGSGGPDAQPATIDTSATTRTEAATTGAAFRRNRRPRGITSCASPPCAAGGGTTAGVARRCGTRRQPRGPGPDPSSPAGSRSRRRIRS